MERAIAINPNGADAYSQLGMTFNAIGEHEEGIKLINKAIRLNPVAPDMYQNNLGYAYLSLGRYEDSIGAYNKVVQRSPDNLFAQIGLTAAYSASGREEEARHQAEELMKLDPAFSLDKYAETVAIKDEAEAEWYIDLLRKAGLK